MYEYIHQVKMPISLQFLQLNEHIIIIRIVVRLLHMMKSCHIIILNNHNIIFMSIIEI